MYRCRRRFGVRTLLEALLVVGALNAFGGGCYGLSGAEGVPVEWLNGSPFSDYRIPSLVLITIVGGSLGGAALALATGSRLALHSTLIAGLILLSWIVVQVAIIGYVSPLQPLTFIAAVVLLVLPWTLMSGDRPSTTNGRGRADGSTGDVTASAKQEP